MMVAQVTGYKAYEFIHTFGDLHIYSNHKNQVKLQLTRKPYKAPIIKINKKSIRVKYDLQEIGRPDLEEILNQKFKQRV